VAGAKRLICKSAALLDGGKAVRFDLPHGHGSAPCFTMRFDGKVFAYVNRCPHRGTELDWNPGEVFDETGLYLICATHGAMFDPQTGLCISGPCEGGRLQALPIEEHDGAVIIMHRRPS
jgi:nitrite reductase/ring-hydroxylating ferredoxin subunit